MRKVAESMRMNSIDLVDKSVRATRKRNFYSNASNPSNDVALEELLGKAAALPMMPGGWYVVDGVRHLIQSHSKFADLIKRHGLPEHYLLPEDISHCTTSTMFPADMNWREPPYNLLLRIIVYQQLNGKAAGSIWKRFSSCFDVDGHLQPHHILTSRIETTTEASGKRKVLINGIESGLSSSKASYVQSLSVAFAEGNLRDVDWNNASDEVIFSSLTAVKGLGPWSVHMFMIFGLRRSHVVPIGDLGMRRGLCILHDVDMNHYEGKKMVDAILDCFNPWKPYGSLANYYLWRLYEESTVTAKKKKVEE